MKDASSTGRFWAAWNGLAVFALLGAASCTEQGLHAQSGDEEDASAFEADALAGNVGEGAEALLVDVPSRAAADWRVLGAFEGHFDPISGLAHVEMVEPDERKRVSRSIPGMESGLRSNEESEAVDGRVRFLQQVSGNGTTVVACENFWNDRWVAGNEDWHFWLPASPTTIREDFLVDLAGDMLEFRFCTNFELINDVGRPLREVWIIVDGITIPGARAWVQALPRVIPSQDGDPDINLERRVHRHHPRPDRGLVVHLPKQ